MIEGRKDDNLLLEKGGSSFPNIVFMDEEGGIVAIEEERSVAGFRKTFHERVRRFMDLRAKARSGDLAAQVDFALLEGDLGRVRFAELRKRLEGKDLSAAQKVIMQDVELGEMIRDVTDAQDDATAHANLDKLAAAYARGRSPSGGERRRQFLALVLEYALGHDDADLAQRALDAVRPLYEEAYGKDNVELQGWLRQTSEQINDLRAAKAGGCGCEDGSGEAKED